MKKILLITCLFALVGCSQSDSETQETPSPTPEVEIEEINSTEEIDESAFTGNPQILEYYNIALDTLKSDEEATFFINTVASNQEPYKRTIGTWSSSTLNFTVETFDKEKTLVDTQEFENIAFPITSKKVTYQDITTFSIIETVNLNDCTLDKNTLACNINNGLDADSYVSNGANKDSAVLAFSFNDTKKLISIDFKRVFYAVASASKEVSVDEVITAADQFFEAHINTDYTEYPYDMIDMSQLKIDSCISGPYNAFNCAVKFIGTDFQIKY